MIAVARPKKKQVILRRALDRRITKAAPRAVVSWVQDHLKLPESDIRRMRKLYEKVMSETITKPESAELDGLIDACAAMDLVRARVLFGSEVRAAKSRAK